ncbi:MAG: DUF4843 domain-containing protein [Odoribacteraceae bacterium]|jgi:hypothetical protein|nr:DUF4843 domain-containing protein [Odoribacteraceae bacterium]
MKNRIIIYSILLLALTACEEKIVNQFDDAPSLFFNRTNYMNAQNDSTSYSFFLAPGGTTVDTVWLDVRLSGLPTGQDRPLPLVQLNAGDSMAAVVGTHYALPASPVMPALAVSTRVPVAVKRVSEMDTSEFRLIVGFTASEHFVAGVKEQATYLVKISAMAVKPVGWDDYYNATFGQWTQGKMRFLIDYLNYTDFDQSLVDTNTSMYLRLKVNALLAAYEEEHGPLYEADGITRVIFP